MLELKRGLDDFDWKAGQVDICSAPGRITYLVGMSKDSPF